MALDEGCRKKKHNDFEIKLCGKIKISIVRVDKLCGLTIGLTNVRDY